MLSPERVQGLPSAFELYYETTEAMEAWIKLNGQEELEKIEMVFQEVV